MHDQASRLRNMVRRTIWPAAEGAGPPLPRVLTVAGGRVSAGCTTVAVNIAGALAQQGMRTVLFDADQHLPEVAARLGLEARASLIDVLESRMSVHEALLPGPAGLQVIAGQRSEEVESGREAALTNLLAALAPHADLVVIDGGSASGEWSRTLWQQAERVLLVAGPDSPAIMETYATVKSIWRAEMQAAVQVLVNRAEGSAVAADVHGRLDRSCRRFLGLALEPGPALPESEGLRWSAPAGKPVVGGDHTAPLGELLERLAETLVNPAVTISGRRAA